MHNLIFCTVCAGALTFVGLGLTIDPAVYVIALVVAVCLVGVPHGGVDSWEGRRWLVPVVGSHWCWVFFSGYLAVAVLVVVGWLVMPLWTAILFFLVSAWHFGWEDNGLRSKTLLWNHLAAIGSGGLVIWIPALCRPSEMQSILEWVVPSSMPTSALQIVGTARSIAMIFVPIAISDFGFSLAKSYARKLPLESSLLRNPLLVALFAWTPILFSFGFYFCGWHSIRGLVHMKEEQKISNSELLFAVLPLSLGAIGLTGAATWFWSSGRELSAELSRSLFIGLSAIAVPHLILNGVVESLPRLTSEKIDHETHRARGLTQ